MDVIRVAVMVKVMAADDFSKGEHIDLALGQRGSGGSAVIDVDELVSVGEVGFQPGECSVGDVKR